MQRIIDGLLYDTDNATLIYHDIQRNRRWYQTENNRYFIAYANGEIRTTTEENVKAYLGEVDIDKYIELFGTVEDA